MSLSFPTSPTVGDTYSFGGRSWRWSGDAWLVSTVIKASALEVFSADTSTDFHGTATTETFMAWSNSTVNSSYVSGFTNGDTEVVANSSQEWDIFSSITVNNSSANDRSTYQMRINHLDSSNATIQEYYVDGLYVRDDNADFDSGTMSGQLRLFVNDGDKIKVSVLVKDEQDNGAGSAPAYAPQSILLIKTITYL